MGDDTLHPCVRVERREDRETPPGSLSIYSVQVLDGAQGHWITMTPWSRQEYADELARCVSSALNHVERRAIREWEEGQAETDAEDQAFEERVRRDVDKAIREAIGKDCWNHLWGPGLEQLGGIIDLDRRGRLKAESERDLLVKALRTYGAHAPWCRIVLHGGEDCTCGYASVLSRITDSRPAPAEELEPPDQCGVQPDGQVCHMAPGHGGPHGSIRVSVEPHT